MSGIGKRQKTSDGYAQDYDFAGDRDPQFFLPSAQQTGFRMPSLPPVGRQETMNSNGMLLQPSLGLNIEEYHQQELIQQARLQQLLQETPPQVSMMAISLQLREIESRYEEKMLRMAQLRELQQDRAYAASSILPMNSSHAHTPNSFLSCHADDQTVPASNIKGHRYNDNSHDGHDKLRDRLRVDQNVNSQLKDQDDSRYSNIALGNEKGNRDVNTRGDMATSIGTNSAPIPRLHRDDNDQHENQDNTSNTSNVVAPLSILADAASTATPSSSKNATTLHNPTNSTCVRDSGESNCQLNAGAQSINDVKFPPCLNRSMPSNQSSNFDTNMTLPPNFNNLRPIQSSNEDMLLHREIIRRNLAGFQNITMENREQENNTHLFSNQTSMKRNPTEESSFKSMMHAPPPAMIFPKKLHKMLGDMTNLNLTHIASWQPHGKCFRINNPKSFTELIMQRYFNQSKFPSFNRQLNLYGFKRMYRNGPDKGCYYHKLFVRDNPELCMSMERTKVNGRGKRCKSNPEEEPIFYKEGDDDGR